MVQIFRPKPRVSSPLWRACEVRQAINYCHRQAADYRQRLWRLRHRAVHQLQPCDEPVLQRRAGRRLRHRRGQGPGADGSRPAMPTASHFTVTAPANYQAHIDTAQIIAQQLQQVGITMPTSRPSSGPPGWRTSTPTPSYEATIVGLTGKLDPDDCAGPLREHLRPRTSTTTPTPPYDQLINDSVTELDEQTRIDNYKQLPGRFSPMHAVAVYHLRPQPGGGFPQGFEGLHLLPRHLPRHDQALLRGLRNRDKSRASALWGRRDRTQRAAA